MLFRASFPGCHHGPASSTGGLATLPRRLLSMARDTRGLQVRRIVGAALGAGHNVVSMGRHANAHRKTKATLPAVTFEHVVSQLRPVGRERRPAA
jgi:hypothetical protein